MVTIKSYLPFYWDQGIHDERVMDDCVEFARKQLLEKAKIFMAITADIDGNATFFVYDHAFKNFKEYMNEHFGEFLEYAEDIDVIMDATNGMSDFNGDDYYFGFMLEFILTNEDAVFEWLPF